MKKSLGFLPSVIILFTFLSNLMFAQETDIKNYSKDELIKSQVETAVSMLNAIFYKYKTGEMSIKEAKKLGADLLRELEYGNDGYFWADTKEGVNVVLYGRKDVEGKNRLEAQDEKGVFFIKEFIKVCKEGGYVEYWFTKKGKTEPEPKRSYVLLFEPFSWIVGTGYYK